ncbi:MAG TPA: ABATE domain-containing protein [Pyrinomonadaceae bacterium]|nr:ABATE domain-containing protein [Pyrinomonadaceae bacterium]
MFFVIANNLALDFANTVIVDGGRQIDLLQSIDDLLEWAVVVGLMDKAGLRKVKDRLSGIDAERAFNAAVELRDTVRKIARDLSLGRPVSKDLLNRINTTLRQKAGYFEVFRSSDGYEKRFQIGTDDVEGLLIAVAESAADLLCFADLTQIKKCENEQCVLHFLDTSKNHRRRWCSMSACGNRAKASAFYHRKKSAEPGTKAAS